MGGVGSPGPVVEAREDGGTVASHDRGGRGEGGKEAGAVGGVAVGSEVNRYYSKPPDWALTLCVT